MMRFAFTALLTMIARKITRMMMIAIKIIKYHCFIRTEDDG